eukprot:1156775-Prorocentrum_minimum.AAC.2
MPHSTSVCPACSRVPNRVARPCGAHHTEHHSWETWRAGWNEFVPRVPYTYTAFPVCKRREAQVGVNTYLQPDTSRLSRDGANRMIRGLILFNHI